MFLKSFWLEVQDIWVISEIISSYFAVTPVGVYSQPHAQLLLSHMCIYVLALFQNHNLFCLFVTNGLLCWFEQLCCVPRFLFKWFNNLLMVSKQFLSILCYSASTYKLSLTSKNQSNRTANKLFMKLGRV